MGLRTPGSAIAAQERHAELREAARGGTDVVPAGKAGDPALSLRERREHQRAVGDALVAGDAYALAAQGIAERRDARLHALATRCSARPMAAAIFSTSRISFSNEGRLSDCMPSLKARSGSGCTSMISPSAPQATAARAIGSTALRIPTPCEGST